MAQHHKFIDIVHKLGQKGYPLKDVYRRIQSRELFLIAYGKLYANDGAMTNGTDPKDTIDGMSIKRIDTIIEKLHTGNYEWKPVRRVYVPKSDGKERPIGILPWSDKLLQEVIRMVFEAYYEPKFSDYSHGFRPYRGCHTALQQIHHTWKGTRWFIEGDIKGCFDNLSHKVILDILAKDIKDNRFLKLIRKMLKAGYMEEWKYHETLSGAPQGGVVSPILSNIVLNELDKFVEDELIPKYNIGKKRKKNPEYYHIYYKIQKAKQEENRTLVKELTKELRKLPEGNPHDPDYRRLRYNRYCDDFLLGYIGPLEEAKQIKEEIREFLETINLEMSDKKTLITHALTNKARYLGYNIAVTKDNGQLSRRGKNRQRKLVSRAINYEITLTVPKDVQKDWRRKYTRNGKPTHRPELLKASDFEIVTTYGQEFRGIVNYYSLAFNVSHAFYPIKYTFIQSAAMTLANKHKTKVTNILKKYKRKSDKGVVALIVKTPNPNNPDKPYRAQLGEQPIKTNLNQVVVDKVYKPFLSRNELTQRLTANICELCNSTQNIEVHHIRKMADIKKRYKGRNEPPKWVKFMMQRNRKTIVICSQCHDKIHTGTYDGKKVN
jgi:group II intron reverse transcriptase/maturase